MTYAAIVALFEQFRDGANPRDSVVSTERTAGDQLIEAHTRKRTAAVAIKWRCVIRRGLLVTMCTSLCEVAAKLRNCWAPLWVYADGCLIAFAPSVAAQSRRQRGT